MKVEATPIYSRGGKKLCVCFIPFFSAAEIVAVTGIPAVMKTILYVRATAVAEIIRRVRAAAAVKAVRVRTAVQAMCPCRISVRRRDAAATAIVAAPGMGSMAANVSAVMFVTIAVSMRCAVAAIVAETECIQRKRRHFAAFFEFRGSLYDITVQKDAGMFNFATAKAEG